MKKIAGKLLLSLTLVFPWPLAAQAIAELPVWMTGAWIETNGESWAEEYWTPPKGGLMIGAGRTGKGKDLLHWEATRIEIAKDGTIAFVAMPEGGAPVRFIMERSDASSISFVSPGHDYPQRIRYWREGAALLAETSRTDGGNAQRWRYHAMGQ